MASNWLSKLRNTKKPKEEKVTSKIDHIVIQKTNEKIGDILERSGFISIEQREKINRAYELVNSRINDESKRTSTYCDMVIRVGQKKVEDLIKILKESGIDLKIGEMLLDEGKISAVEQQQAVLTFLTRQTENRGISFGEALLLNKSILVPNFIQFLQDRRIPLKFSEFGYSKKLITEEQMLTCLKDQEVGETFQDTLLRLYPDDLDYEGLRLVDKRGTHSGEIKEAEVIELTDEEKAKEFAAYIVDDDTDDDTTQFKITSTKNDTFDDTDDDTITIMGVTNDKFSVKPKNLNKKSPKTK